MRAILPCPGDIFPKGQFFPLRAIKSVVSTESDVFTQVDFLGI